MKTNTFVQSVLIAASAFLLATGCSDGQPSSGIPSDTSNHSYFVFTKGDNLELDIIDNQNESLQGSFAIDKAFEEQGSAVAPKSVTMQNGNGEIWIAIGTVNDPTQNKIYTYDGKTGKLNFLTTIPSISNWTTANQLVWTTRHADNQTYLEAYNPEENWKRTRQIVLDDYPTSIVYDSQGGDFYILVANSIGNAYRVERWSLDGQKLQEINLPGPWAYGSMTIWNGNLWVAQTTYNPDAKDSNPTSGNHILELPLSLRGVNTWPVIKSPNQLLGLDGHLYVLSSTQTESKIGIYSWSNGQLNLSKTYTVNAGLHRLGRLQRNSSQIYALGDNQLEVISESKMRAIGIDGTTDNTWLP